MLTGTAAAFEDSAERYPTGSNTDYWTKSTTWSAGSPNSYTSTLSQVEDPRGISNTVLKLDLSYTDTNEVPTIYNKMKTNNVNLNQQYISFNIIASAYTYESLTTNPLQVSVYKTGTTDLLATFTTTIPTTPTKIEIIQTGSYFNLYKNGVQISSVANSAPAYTGGLDLEICTISKLAAAGVTRTTTRTLYIDDLTDSSIIGIPEAINDGTANITFTWGGQLIRNNPLSEYEISLYSLTSPNNVGQIKSYTLSGASQEFGYISESNSLLTNSYGLYLLELKKDSTVIYNTYFYYDDLANPIGLPETLWIATSDVSMDIRDHANNGGLISPGGSVYLYATNGTAGYYPISYELKNTPYSFTATLEKIYSSETIHETEFTFSGLTNYYNVELDGENIGTVDDPTYTYTVTDWENFTEHIFSFSPDLTKPGAYGYVKDLSTKTGIQGAIITISNDSYSQNLATDETGYFYITNGLIDNKTYTISAAKSGYTASSEFTILTKSNETTRKDIHLDPVSSGAGYYYAPHDVIFTVLEYWYSSAGLPGVNYSVYDGNESVKNGTTGSKGAFTVKDMDAGKNYTFILTYNNQTYTEYIEPGLTEYNLVLNKEGIVHQYYNSWLNLTYAENSNNATILYTSNKTLSAASLSVTASNGTIVQSNTLNTTSGTFTFNFTEGDYILQFDIDASDGSTASQAWSISSPPEVTLFPASYPAWLKNTLFVAIIIIFLLAFGKSKNDIACGSVAVLTSLGYYFEWLTCSFNFVVLVWIIALGAIFLHYKRTGAVG